jgi:site-specific DNA recombinase
MFKYHTKIPDLPTLQARKAVILARVSSKEQEEGYSIDAQKHRLELYCARRSLEVIRTFEIIESSTQGDRKQFMALIRFAKDQKETIAIVADKVDRVQRSFKEYPLLDALVQQGKIELHFNTENYVIHKDSVSQERLMWSMGVIMAQSYIDSMRDNVKRSFDQKIRTGEWIAMSPIGYINVRDPHGRGTIIVDEARAPLIRRMFEEYATGAYTISDIHRRVMAWGLTNLRGQQKPPVLSQVHGMLNNPFYYGVMKIKGKLYQHRYPPIVSKATFDQCQAVMKGWHKKPYVFAGKEFVFRGLITCATTGRVVTADTKSKVYIKDGRYAEWTYLRCWNPDNPEKIMWVREDKILAEVEDILRRIHIEPETKEMLCKHLQDTDQSERAFVRQQVGEWQKEYTLAQNRLNRLMDLLIDGTIHRDEFEKKKAQIREDQLTLEKNMAGARDGDDSFKDSMLALLDIISQAHALFKGSHVEEKRRLVNFLFANLKLKGPTLCYELRKPFDRMVDLTNSIEWLGRLDSNQRMAVPKTAALPLGDAPKPQRTAKYTKDRAKCNPL